MEKVDNRIASKTLFPKLRRLSKRIARHLKLSQRIAKASQRPQKCQCLHWNLSRCIRDVLPAMELHAKGTYVKLQRWSANNRWCIFKVSPICCGHRSMGDARGCISDAAVTIVSIPVAKILYQRDNICLRHHCRVDDHEFTKLITVLN